MRAEPILVFRGNDKPADSVATRFDPSTLQFKVVMAGVTNPPVWKGVKLPTDSPVAIEARSQTPGASKKSEVVVLSRVYPVQSSSDLFNAPEDHVRGMDIRTAQGKRMDNQRREYGNTYSNAASKPQQLAAEENYAKRAEKFKRDREKLEQTIDATLATDDGAERQKAPPQPKPSAKQSRAAEKPKPKGKK
jgi:hypothetical protein